MNLYLRLFKHILILIFRRKKLGLLDTSVIHGRIWPNDLDLNFHVNNGRYLTLMDLGRFDLVIRAGFFKPMLKNRMFPVLGALKMNFRRPLKLFQTYTLKTRLLAWDEKWLYLEQTFEVGGEVYAKGIIQGLFMSPQGKVPSQFLMDCIHWDQPSPELPEGVGEWLRKGEIKK
jgi:acyl-CoA thioesterase FadM